MKLCGQCGFTAYTNTYQLLRAPLYLWGGQCTVKLARPYFFCETRPRECDWICYLLLHRNRWAVAARIDTHTHSQLYRIPCVAIYASRHNMNAIYASFTMLMAYTPAWLVLCSISSLHGWHFFINMTMPAGGVDPILACLSVIQEYTLVSYDSKCA